MKRALIKQPLYFSPDLTNERLDIISRLLLDAYYSALRDANTELDDSYTRGTLTFGRQRQAVIKTYKKGLYTWLSVEHSGNDLIFGIGEIRNIRFFKDDFSQPKKRRVFEPTLAELRQLPIFEPSNEKVKLWRFIVEPAINQESNDTVHLIGINEFNEYICHWVYDSVRVLHSSDDSTPPPKELTAAPITPKSENSELNKKQNDV